MLLGGRHTLSFDDALGFDYCRGALGFDDVVVIMPAGGQAKHYSRSDASFKTHGDPFLLTFNV
jgi:hypothetical protein